MNLLESFLARSEGKRLEFKRDLSSPTPFLKTVVAFANTAGGTIVVGVTDQTKEVIGVTKPLELEERIANLIHDGVEPVVIPTIEIMAWRKKSVLSIDVALSSMRPHFMKKKGLEQGAYVRVGSTNRVADRLLIEELKRSVQNRSFDEEPMVDLGAEEIDFRAASELFAEQRKLTRRNLKTLRLAMDYQGTTVPTVAGILLFGKNRDKHFPDAWVQCGRFKGENKADILDHRESHHIPILAIEDGYDFIKKHAEKRLEIRGTRGKKVWNVPLLAVREAIINAVLHADYSMIGSPIRISYFDNRIEIESPGLLLSGLSVKDIKQGVSRLRNRAIGRVFRELGYIEQWGSGIQRMLSNCREMGLPEPVFEEIGTHFRVTLPLRTDARLNLDATDRQIISILRRNGPLSTKLVSVELGVSARTARSRLGKLADKGILTVLGAGPRDPRRKYALSGEV